MYQLYNKKKLHILVKGEVKMNKDSELFIKKIEEESKLIKGDASKNEMQ